MKELKRSKIIECAIDEFSSKGYDQVSTTSIAKLSGVTQPLVYHYFKSKEELYAECVRVCMMFYSEEKYSEKLSLLILREIELPSWRIELLIKKVSLIDDKGEIFMLENKIKEKVSKLFNNIREAS